MRIAVLTSLYPLPEAPRGLFAARKWEGMASRGHEVVITRPALGPAGLAGFSPPSVRASPAPAVETRGGIQVRRPRSSISRARECATPGGLPRRSPAVMGDRVRPDAVVLDYAWPAAAAAPDSPIWVCRSSSTGAGATCSRCAPSPPFGPSRGVSPRRRHHRGQSGSPRCHGGAAAEAEPRGRRASVLTPNGVDGEAFCPGDRRARGPRR